MQLKMVIVFSAISALVGFSELSTEAGTMPASTLPGSSISSQNQTTVETKQGLRPLYFIETGARSTKECVSIPEKAGRLHGFQPMGFK